ncbi:MAG: tRNA (adenosine(37)-N6)-threonylcarbamoyltransferase complex transferase subunit TsaD [Flavobacteriales bacterium]|nr:MAG: tRNA (adenosine(37)-N6)-threonylcarbamoyltransferase complex transferase subunit TsaD [Flavobacteriales bacterium]
MPTKPIIILGIESSCDDTAAAVVKNGVLLSNVVADQHVHEQYGGVVPELASRAHQQNMVPVIQQALQQAGIDKEDLSAIAYTRGPGLLGSLLVGASFAKGLALGLNVPLIEVNHMQAHVLAHFIKDETSTLVPIKSVQISNQPSFPFLCLTVSGGHTQIVMVNDYFDMEVIGTTLDDAAGEAFDKAGKIMGLPYPAGPLVDNHAQRGNSNAFTFPHPRIPKLDFSFSGLKTAVLYFIRDELKKNPNFIDENIQDLCASIQKTIVNILLDKLKTAAVEKGINEIAIAGGVSANSGLRAALEKMKQDLDWNVYIPKFEYCTDNAAMIAITGYFKCLNNDFSSQKISATARLPL